EIKFPLDFARGVMEPSQIERSLFEDSGRQIFPARLELVIVGSVHVVVNCFVISFSIFRRPIFQKISEFLRESPRSSFFLAVIVLPAGLDWSGRIETEQQNDEGKDYWRYTHGFLHHRKKIARTRKPSKTPSSGLETANQKETSQSEVVELIFTLFSQAFEDQHFTRI